MGCFYCRDMCKALNPKYNPSSRSNLSDMLILSWYDVEKANLISELKDVPKLAIISDGWTSLSQDCDGALHKPRQAQAEGPPHQGSLKKW